MLYTKEKQTTHKLCRANVQYRQCNTFQGHAKLTLLWCLTFIFSAYSFVTEIIFDFFYRGRSNGKTVSA